MPGQHSIYDQTYANIFNRGLPGDSFFIAINEYFFHQKAASPPGGLPSPS
jgi:hypothetical protein